MNRQEKHKILVQWFMDCNGVGIGNIFTEQRIDELLEMTDEEFENEWEIYLEESK